MMHATTAHIEVLLHEGPLPDAAPSRIEGAGAVVVFEGIVRPSEDDRPIRGLDHEIYSPMAQRELERLARETRDQFGLVAIRVEHSRGFVPNFACSFRLSVAAAHRKEALAAMETFIDRMKRDVPIWKRPVHDQPEATL